MPNIGHKVRIVILWQYKNDAELIKIFVTNKIHWNVKRIVETYRSRWTGTETFHRDGKQRSKAMNFFSCSMKVRSAPEI